MKKEPPFDASKEKSLTGLRREILEIKTLYEITRRMGMPLPLEERMNRALDVLHENMGMERATLTLLDAEGENLTIEIAHGMDTQALKKGRYKVGEGITGKVVEAGEPIAIPNIGEEPLFLNRTGARKDLRRSRIAFICVPIKIDQETIGALSVDRLFAGDVSLDEDLRLLTIISSLIAQNVANYRLREQEKTKLQFENTELKRELAKKFHPANILGESKRMKEVYEAIEMVSRTRSTVLLRGETGTGKSSSLTRSTIQATGRRGLSSRFPAPRSRKRFSKANFSVMKKVPLPARPRTSPGVLNWRTAAPFFWTRSAIFRPTCRLNFSVRFRSGSSSASGGPGPFRSMYG